MKRVSDPEIRKQQILETAMKLFYEKGYENTSLEDLANELNIVKGLCYRYFNSKQALLYAVFDEYTTECCQDFVAVIHNRELPFTDRLNKILSLLIQPEGNGRYHDFFHKAGNESMHEQLAGRMCNYMIPHLLEELTVLNISTPEIKASFLMYGLIGIWQDSRCTTETKMKEFDKLVSLLFTDWTR